MNSLPTKNPLKRTVTDAPLNWVDLVRQQVASLQFGTVEIVVHDSRVVQIEKTERLRLGSAEAARLQTPAVSSGDLNPGPTPGTSGTTASGL